MQKLWTACVIGATCLVVMMMAPMTAVATPLGISGAAAVTGEAQLAEEIRYVCRRVRHCGYNGCWWRDRCYWTPGPWRHHRWRHHYRRHHYW